MVDNKQQWKAWLYLSPAIVLLLIFTVWPIINTVQMAFLENYDALKAAGIADEYENAAKKNGTKLLRDNVSELVQLGKTTIDELVRVTYSV